MISLKFAALAAVAIVWACPAQAQLGGLLGGVTNTVDQVTGSASTTLDGTVNLATNAAGVVGDTLDGLPPDVGGLLPGEDPLAPPSFLIQGVPAGALPDTLIAQLQMLIEIIRAREWMQYEEYGLGARPRVGAVDLRRWVPESSWDDLNAVMVEYAGDILGLQQSILSGVVLPRWTGFRRLPVSRVIAFDFEEANGTVVLYFS